MEEKELELRMYFFVPYNISPIQKAIQAGHAALEYAYEHGRTELFKKFVKKWKTWIILDGGSTNESEEPERMGTMQEILTEIVRSGVYPFIDFAVFQEPDLNDTLTAICFIVDERVFNREDYPNYLDWILNIKMTPEARDAMPAANVVMLKMQSMEKLQEMFPEWYPEWVKFLGGERNLFLRELLRDKRLA